MRLNVCVNEIAPFGLFASIIGLCSLGALKSSFSAPKRKNLVFFCFVFFRRRLVMVFGGQITFSTPQVFFGPVFFFFFPAPPRYGVRRPNNLFDSVIFFSAPPPKKKRLGRLTNRRLFFLFRRSEKPPFFGAQNQKSA